MRTEEMLRSKQNIVRQAALDYLLKGDPWTALGMISWAQDQGATKERIILFAERRLHIPYHDAKALIDSLTGGTYVH